jgi:hypothetical protein
MRCPPAKLIAALMLMCFIFKVQGAKTDTEIPKNKNSSKKTESLMSYNEAMNLAMNGYIFQGIVDAMKRELLKAEISGDVGYINQIKVNSAVSLIKLGGRIDFPKKYMEMYSECEKYLLSVLSVDPRHEFAIKNLESVRRNRHLRDPKDEIQPSEPPRVPLEKQPSFTPENKHTAANLEFECSSKGQCHGNFGKRWLTIGIPTVPRRGDPDYLNQTVNAITKQLPTRPDDPLYGRVIVVILNNLPGQHTLFDDVRRRIESGPHSSYFRFEEAEISTDDGINNPENHTWIPGKRVLLRSEPPSRISRATPLPATCSEETQRDFFSHSH